MSQLKALPADANSSSRHVSTKTVCCQSKSRPAQTGLQVQHAVNISKKLSAYARLEASHRLKVQVESSRGNWCFNSCAQ